MGLGLAATMIFLIALAAPVSALQTNIVIEELNIGYASGANNHTYVYIPPDPLDSVSRSWMDVDEDLDMSVYRYDSTGWARALSSVPADMKVPFNWLSFNGWGTGPFANPTLLPEFYDFAASDDSEHFVNTTLQTRTFGLSFGQHTPVLVETGYVCYGTLRISNQEFVHLTIDSRQDDVSWSIVIIDPEGRFMTSYGGSDGDIWTLPFKPSIAGTYYVILQAFPTSGTFSMFDILPKAVSPQVIAPENIVTGELPTGEIIMREDTGSWVHQELAPTVHTYKVNSPDDVASLTYAFNYPEMFIGITQPPSIRFTSDLFTYGYDGGQRYENAYGSPTTGEYFFRGGPYYVTVMGGDNIEYTLYHQTNSQGVLPVNEKFQVMNDIGTTVHRAYILDVEEPSVLRVNSTASGAELDLRIIGISEDGFRHSRTINFASAIEDADNYFLPVGEYIVEMDVAISPVYEWVKFNLNPLTTETQTGFTYVGGFQVSSQVFRTYNLSLFLNNRDNVTVRFEQSVYDSSGLLIDTSAFNLANRWDGSTVIPHPSIANNWTEVIAWNRYYDGPVYVTYCAWEVLNNTQGATNEYMDYTVDVTLDWVSNYANRYDRIVTLDVAAGASSDNYTLSLPGSATELYAFSLNTTPGTWYNVSVKTADVSSFSAGLYSRFDGRTHTTGWTDLNDELVGTTADLSFQFGAISDSLLLEMVLNRPLVTDGFLYVRITPLATHELDITPITPPGPDILGMLGGFAIPAVVGVGVIVVVIVYVKRFKK